MSEKAAGKRAGRFVRGLTFAYAVERCVAAAVLMAVLVAGLLARAPWRINVVIGLVLVNVALSPWRRRLFFDMVFLLIAAGVAAWVLSPNRDVGRWEPYVYRQDIARAEAARRIAPEENAAAVYARLFAAYNADDFDEALYNADPEHRTLTRAWVDADYPDVKRWLQEHAEGLTLLREAAALPQCRFELATTQLERDAVMWRTNLAKRWGLVLMCAISNDLGEGRKAAAMEKIGILRRMAQHLYQQQMLFDMPRGLELERMAYNAMSRLVVEGEPTEQELAEMEGWLLPLADTQEADWQRVYENEKLYIKHIAGLFYEVNEAGEVRCSRNSVLAVNEQFKMGLHAVRYMQHAPRVTGLFLWFTIPHRPERTGRVIDRVFARYYDEMSKPGGEERLRRRAAEAGLNYKGIIELAAWQTVNWVYPQRRQWSKRLTCRNAALVLIALKRYQRANGEWPAALEAVAAGELVTDPINGGRFAYRRKGEGFVLYSTGVNGVDEDGRNDPQEGSDDLWIWPARLSMLAAVPAS